MSARPLEMCRGAALASLLLVALTGCGTTVRSVRLDTGQGEPLVHVPRGRHLPVELTREELTPALGELARGVRPPTRPQEAARRLFEVAARSGSFLYEARDRRLTPLAPGEHLEGEPLAAEMELTRAYLRWCERTGRPGDCLLLLTECPTLNGDGRYALAMALARGAVLDEMLEAFKDMADPHAMVAAVLWTWTTYMLLLAVPEPVSKGLAAVMTVTLISYVGVDTFWSLIVGFKQLMEEADRATTFHELREAGERYGKVMGHNAARAFALLATAAIGHTAAGLAAKVPKLPGSVQAAAQAQTQVHIRLAAVGAVEMVSVSAETLTLSLAPGALAMTSRGPGEGNGSTSNNPGTANGTNSTTTRQQDGTTYRFNTGHAFNRAHKTGSDLRQTSLSSDEVETAIMSHLRTYRASGGRLPVAQNGAVPTPHIGRVTVGPYTLEFSAVQASNNTVFVGTYYLLP